METETLLKIACTLVDGLLIGFLIWDMFKMKEMKDIIDKQQNLIDFQHIMLDLGGILHKVEVIKQERCCGSTSASKAEGQGSTLCSCATIMKELEK